MAELDRSDDDSTFTAILTPSETEPAAEAEDPEKDGAGDAGSSKDGADESAKKEVHLKGMVSESKILYAKFDDRGNKSWSDKKPADFEEAAEGEETQKFAIIVRKQKPRDADYTKNLEIDSIIIQSPHLKVVLADVLHNYPGITTNLSRLKLKAPFECFLHRWEKFEAARNAEYPDPTTKEHLGLLYDIMKEELGELINLRKDYLKNKFVSFEHLWTILPPECIIYGHKEGKPVAALFKRGHYVRTNCGPAYNLDCRIIEWDGVKMGWNSVTMQVPGFLGFENFTCLPCYPLEYHHSSEAVKEMLRERGRRFESLAGYHYRQYEGVALYHPEADTEKTCRENIQSRIVVDCANWEKYNPDHRIWLDALHPDNNDEGNGYDSDNDESDRYSCNSYDSSSTQNEENEVTPLTEEQLIFTSPIVRGYSLGTKRWMEFFLDDVTDVEFDTKAFSSLVMPAEKKELILAFAEAQAKYKDAFDDVITGKGKGIIMLLCGGPGIGKTLTAESVAEQMRVPIYSMSAGDLGNDAYSVENSLGSILKMVSNWNAVLLLDECDVFLEERTSESLERNRIVAIFLRMLEYYEGILFLTTNRIKQMDPAFHSRIHITIEYGPLDQDARAKVWKAFLGRSVSLDRKTKGNGAHNVGDVEIAELSKLDLNGRVIKNMVKAANLLAFHRKERLDAGHLRTVLRVAGHSL
ncbi:hypothetical protein QQS21_006358 [Conoideocrella luteorostrata]|uniref:AAA+ ATPase domain-containing protein n=1 Tax=Conoideocrella luteorostrata TaxID=1105319 RepID=A0AAJ0CQP3_9HYPO|nr:hypothetical protein QQS21_006358 [Conoideocrella luteorostrata]